jgi:hypothetical protein
MPDLCDPAKHFRGPFGDAGRHEPLIVRLAGVGLYQVVSRSISVSFSAMC